MKKKDQEKHFLTKEKEEDETKKVQPTLDRNR